MIVESIFLLICFASLGGSVIILARKIPLLNSLSRSGTTGIENHRVVVDLQERVREILINLEKQIYLHKLLSWIKIITLKVESRIDILLHNVREKAKKVDKELKDKKYLDKLPK